MVGAEVLRAFLRPDPDADEDEEHRKGLAGAAFLAEAINVMREAWTKKS